MRYSSSDVLAFVAMALLAATTACNPVSASAIGEAPLTEDEETEDEPGVDPAEPYACGVFPSGTGWTIECSADQNLECAGISEGGYCGECEFASNQAACEAACESGDEVYAIVSGTCERACMTAEECPMPLSGDAERFCGEYCFLACDSTTTCPDGFECLPTGDLAIAGYGTPPPSACLHTMTLSTDL